MKGLELLGGKVPLAASGWIPDQVRRTRLTYCRNQVMFSRGRNVDRSARTVPFVLGG